MWAPALSRLFSEEFFQGSSPQVGWFPQYRNVRWEIKDVPRSAQGNNSWTGWSSHALGKEKVANREGFILLNSRDPHHRWLYPGTVLNLLTAKERQARKTIRQMVSWQYLPLEMTLTLKVHFPLQLQHASYPGHCMQNRWSQMKPTPLSVSMYLRKQSVKENDMLLNALPTEGQPPQNHWNMVHTWTFSYAFDCLYTMLRNTLRTGKHYNHLQTAEPQSQGTVGKQYLWF